MMTREKRFVALGALFFAIALSAGAVEIQFRKHILDRGTAEACCVADVNKDGNLDIVCGDNWYMGPDWWRRPCRPAPYKGQYKNDCGDWPFDVNGDGWVDIVTAGFFEAGLAWAENPKDQYKPWPLHPFSPPHFVETILMVDVDGDGRPDILPDDNEPIRWIEITRDASGKPSFVTHLVGKNGTGHGIGYGDVNGDNRLDILTPDGWYEGPADPRKQPWPWHGEFKLDTPGIPIRTLDVNGDGLNDIIWGMGHNYGLFWMEQVKTRSGKRRWKQHTIDKSWSQVHTVTLADLSGDGVPDIITAKRYHAHNGHDPGGNDPLGVYWYELDRANARFIKHVIEYGGTAGGGLQIPVVDIDKDGDLDIITPGKSGLYLFENLGPKK